MTSNVEVNPDEIVFCARRAHGSPIAGVIGRSLDRRSSPSTPARDTAVLKAELTPVASGEVRF